MPLPSSGAKSLTARSGQPVPRLVRHLGPSWIAHPDYVVYTIITLSVWQFGSAMVIFLAGLKQIPIDLYEASGVDGAGKIRQFFGITRHAVTRYLFNLIMSMINSFQAFTPAYVIGDGRGGPLDATMFYTLYLYLKGFSFFDMGYASALAWIMLVIIGVFTGIVFLHQNSGSSTGITRKGGNGYAA